jgi:hypothetical protein
MIKAFQLKYHPSNQAIADSYPCYFPSTRNPKASQHQDCGQHQFEQFHGQQLYQVVETAGLYQRIGQNQSNSTVSPVRRWPGDAQEIIAWIIQPKLYGCMVR